MNKNFAYSERLLGIESDNQINYYAGPMKISISGWSEKIEISCKKKWEYLLEEVVDIAKKAWEVNDDQIKFEAENNVKKVIIKYNYKNLKLYIEHAVVLR
jgi:hypothetical protein